MPLEWHGDELAERVRRAAAAAIDDTTAATDDQATAAHEFRNETGNLERRIITEPARDEGAEIVGKVGIEYAHGEKEVRDGFYGLFVETHRPFLRPAADAMFPTLARRIKEKLDADS